MILKGNALLDLSLNSRQEILHLYQLEKTTPGGRLKIKTSLPIRLVQEQSKVRHQSLNLMGFPASAFCMVLLTGLLQGSDAALSATQSLSQHFGNALVKAANAQLKEPAFRLKALKSKTADLEADFEALHFSKAEMKKLAKTAQKLSLDISSPAHLSAYVVKTLQPFVSMAEQLKNTAYQDTEIVDRGHGIKSLKGGSFRAGLLYKGNPLETPAESVEDITHMVQWPKNYD